RLRDWLLAQGYGVVLLERAEQLPLVTRVVAPHRVGIDRLLDAVAAKRRLPAGQPAVLVDAGSAVTVDWLDESHTFCGGAIFPGFRLMAQSLIDYTAFLPLVTIRELVPALPAADTVPALETGIFHAVVGGIEKIVHSLAARSAVPPALFVTGGDGALLHKALDTPIPAVFWPDQTLEGVLASAEVLP
ncbi:MAG: type III pantothenate kinase, partial [Planctomycetes bacterium]|nr:type III pantothenate kinase [Planctomycetota bacterium]